MLWCLLRREAYHADTTLGARNVESELCRRRKTLDGGGEARPGKRTVPGTDKPKHGAEDSLEMVQKGRQ